MLNLAILVSGDGSNLQSIINAINEHQIKAKIKIVIASKDNIFAIERAEKAKIKTVVISKNNFLNTSDEILRVVTKEKIDLIVMAGYLSILSGKILDKYKDKIINIHPSLIPNFCGPGMYGRKVHEAVKKSRVKKTGCTVHYVTAEVDGGKIILQREVEIDKNDSVDQISQMVLSREHEAIVEAIKIIAKDKDNSQ